MAERDPSRRAFVTGGSGFIGGALVRRLAADGWIVHGLARSDRSADAVSGAGGEPVPGDLDSPAALRAGAEGCSVAFHAAAAVAEWGPRELFVRSNVTGTQNVLRGCEAAGVRRFVHVGTEAAVMGGQPLDGIDETAPLRPDSKSHYCSTKALAERAVRDATREGFETVVIRPRLVWGPGDTTILPGLLEAIEQGRFAWISGGRHRTSTTHVDNVVEGLVLGASRGRPGGVYFVTDGEPVVFREFVTDLVRTRGVEPPGRSIPAPIARIAAGGAELAWRGLRRESPPPLTRTAVWLASLETTIDISRAREELGYAPVRSRADGLAELSRSRPKDAGS